MPTESDAAGTRRFVQGIKILNKSLRDTLKLRRGLVKSLATVDRATAVITEMRDKLVAGLKQRSAALAQLRRGAKRRGRTRKAKK
jgi:hypothetical protein